MRTLLLFLLGIALASCDTLIPAPSRGCTDSAALNRDFGAEEDDGSCQYSSVIFYKAVPGPPVQVSVDGQPVGSIAAFYPSGPGNCSAPGSATYQLRDGRVRDWTGISGPFISTGTIRADPFSACLRVRVF